MLKRYFCTFDGKNRVVETSSPCSACDAKDPAWWAQHDAAATLKRLRGDGEARAAMIRLVVSQQWAVAITLLHDGEQACEWLVDVSNNGFEDGYDVGTLDAITALADLPCAVDVVADLLGAPCSR